MAHFGNIICVENGPLIHGNDTLFPGLIAILFSNSDIGWVSHRGIGFPPPPPIQLLNVTVFPNFDCTIGLAHESQNI